MGISSWLTRKITPMQWGPPIHLVRHTPLISLDEMDAIAQACDTQLLRDVAPAHSIAPSRVLHTHDSDVPAGVRAIRFVDDAGDDAYGWHTEDTGDLITGIVGVRTVLDNAGSILTGPLSVSSVASHEVIEMACNPHVSLWADTGQGHLVAFEIGDPVQSDSYLIGGVAVSNFVTGQWFSPISTPGDRFDYLGHLGAPFAMGDGGYVLQLQGGEVTPVFGADFPAWLWNLKQRAASRSSRLTTGRPS